MRPLPQLAIAAGDVAAPKLERPRRSKRNKKSGNRLARLELRCEDHEKQRWTRAAAAAGYLSVSDWLRDAANQRAKLSPLVSSIDMTGNTPQIVLDALLPLGPIALDPCSNATSIVRARVRWQLPEQDGLALPWGYLRSTSLTRRRGLVYVNPPYGDDLPLWTAKIRAELELSPWLEIAVLVPARTETDWFEELVSVSSAIAYWHGRLRFHGEASTAPFPSVIFYAGRRRALFARSLRRHARVELLAA